MGKDISAVSAVSIVRIVVIAADGEEAVRISCIVKIDAYNLLLRVNAEWQGRIATGKVDGLEVSTRAQESMRGKVDVIIGPYNVSTIVNCSRLSIALPGDVKLLRGLLAVEKAAECPGIKEWPDNIAAVVDA